MNLPCITTSWDDGHPLDFRVADLLSRYGLTGTFYIPRRCQTPTMSPEQVTELSRYFEIGAHTMDHVFLDSCNDQTAREQIGQSKAWVEELTGKPCPMFCPPGGKFDAKRLSQISAAGFKAIRTVEMISVAPPKLHNDLLIMPTTLQAHPHSPTAYLRNVLKRKGRNLWLYLTRGHQPNWVQLAERLLKTAIARNGVFHLWGHSWEIQESGQWEHLETVFKMMSELRQQAPCVTNWQLISRHRVTA
jgi:peptidoglycan/xylan/chitin deacetylase (PgdA/CDA1 family)